MRVRRIGLGMSVVVWLCMVFMTPGLAAASSQWDAAWAEVERLVSEDKLAEASPKVEMLLDRARAAGDEEMWTRALLRATQLRTALHKPEQAVLFLWEEPWPPGAVHRVALHLYYAQALATYARTYSGEIGQRERVGSGGRIALERWTGEQIVEAARTSCRQALSLRKELGDLPVSAASFWLDPCDSPAYVRGTLRDATSYLCAEVFDSWGLWFSDRDDLLGQDLPALINSPSGRSCNG